MDNKIEKTRIRFTYEGKDYTLEFTEATVKTMDRNGFDFAQMDTHTVTYPEDLWCGAFMANHDDVSYEKRIEIFKEIGGESEDGSALNDVLFKMVIEAITEARSHKGNVKWKVGK